MSTGMAAAQARISEIQSRFAVPMPVRPLSPDPSGARSGATSAGVGEGGEFARALSRAGAGASVLSRAGAGASVLSRAGAGTSISAPSRGGPPAATPLITAAKEYLGVPYLWGGTDPSKGLDCSGFVQLAFSDIGIDLPRVSRDQAQAGRPVPGLARARPGDLVAFGSPVDHIGIYLGGGEMIVAPHTGAEVRIQELHRTPTAIRRILPDPVPAIDPSAGAGFAAAAGLGRTELPGSVPLESLFERAGARHGVSAPLLAAVARAESGFDPRALSSAGARGLMQIMPATARGLGVDPWDPAQAVDGAARLLADHLDTFGSVELALAAYNAGPGAVRRYDGIPPYAETQAYVRRVLSYLSEAAA